MNLRSRTTTICLMAALLLAQTVWPGLTPGCGCELPGPAQAGGGDTCCCCCAAEDSPSAASCPHCDSQSDPDSRSDRGPSPTVRVDRDADVQTRVVCRCGQFPPVPPVTLREPHSAPESPPVDATVPFVRHGVPTSDAASIPPAGHGQAAQPRRQLMLCVWRA